jgi:ribosomal-protein-alanine N-acetyltransferase
MSATLAPKMSFRPLQEADLLNIIKIETATYAFPWTLQIFKDCLRVGYIAQVLEFNAQIRGYGIMSIAAGEAQLFNLCVDPKWQGHGYGELILKHLRILAKQKQAHAMFLEVRLSNQVAINLYHKIGFNQIGRRKRYYPVHNKKREDALIFALEL